MAYRILLALILVLLMNPGIGLARSRHRPATTAPAAQLLPSAIEIDKLENSTLFFRATAETVAAPGPLKLEFYEPKVLGAIYNKSPALPYFVLAGKSTPDGEKEIFVVRSNTRPTRFVYPGRILDPKTRATLLESRAFIGRCLFSNPNSVFVVFQRERVDRRHQMQPSVFLAEAGEDHLTERLIERGFPRVNDTLKLVKAKTCREIDGQNRLMLRKPLDLTPRHGVDDSDDDDEESDPSSGDGKTN